MSMEAFGRVADNQMLSGTAKLLMLAIADSVGADNVYHQPDGLDLARFASIEREAVGQWLRRLERAGYVKLDTQGGVITAITLVTGG